MKRKLYANSKRFVTVFFVCICVMTGILLILRLTVFRDMATAPLDAVADSAIVEVQGDVFNYKYNSKIYFSKSTANGDVLIENPDSNECLMSVTIFDPVSKDSYLYTGFIEPGNSVETAKLEIDLEEGVHQCSARITAYDPDSYEPLGSVEEPVSLYIGVRPE